MLRLRTPALIGPAHLRGRRGLSVTIRNRPPSLLLLLIGIGWFKGDGGTVPCRESELHAAVGRNAGSC